MIHRACLLVLLALSLASPPGYAAVYKCRQGEGVIYQSQPCPAGSVALSPPDTLPPPSAYEVEAARDRAKKEIAEAAALRKREEQKLKAQEKRHAAVGKFDTDCTRLLGKIEEAEDKASLSKLQKSRLKSDQRKYRKDCGPL